MGTGDIVSKHHPDVRIRSFFEVKRVLLLYWQFRRRRGLNQNFVACRGAPWRAVAFEKRALRAKMDFLCFCAGGSQDADGAKRHLHLSKDIRRGEYHCYH